MPIKSFNSILLVFISLIWGGSFVLVDMSLNEISPINLGFLRFLVATPVMLSILFLRKAHKTIPIKEFPNLLLLSFTGVILLYFFQFTGIALTTASTSSILINTNVVFIALLSIIVLKEAFSLKKAAGICLSFVGVVVVVIAQATNENIMFTTTFFIGCLLILLSALCWAIYSIVGKRLLETYDTLTVTTYVFTLGLLLFIPIVFSDIFVAIKALSSRGWLIVLYLALLCSIFGYVGWYSVLSKIDASKAAVFLNLIPMFTILISYFLGESLTFFFIIGAILIIYGVYLTQKS